MMRQSQLFSWEVTRSISSFFPLYLRPLGQTQVDKSIYESASPFLEYKKSTRTCGIQFPKRIMIVKYMIIFSTQPEIEQLNDITWISLWTILLVTYIVFPQKHQKHFWAKDQQQSFDSAPAQLFLTVWKIAFFCHFSF